MLDLEGHKELERAFKRLEGPMQGKATRSAMRRAWKVVHAAATAKVAVLTGRLKAGLKLRATKTKRGAGGSVFGVRVLAPYRDQLGIADSAKGYYPFSLEFGRRTKSGARVGMRPFMRPAFDETKDRAYSTFRTELGTEIGKLWGKP